MARFVLEKKKLLSFYEQVCGCADEVSYSFKTNYEVGKVLESATSCSFSVHSVQAARLIADRSRVWYFAQGWCADQVKEALSMGVRRFVLDNRSDLDVLLNAVGPKKVDVLLRMRLQEHSVQTGKHFVFGFYSSELNTLVPRVRAHPSVGMLGLHVHRKTQNVSEWSLKEEFEQSVHSENWSLIDVVNIGGGIPAVYKNFRSESLPVIFSRIKALREWLAHKSVRLIIEPGRYLAAPAIVLETTVINIYDGTIIVDASVFNAAMDTFIAHHRLLVQGEEESGAAYTIKGCTPDSLDIFRYKVFLKDVKVGQTIRFLNAGAYNFSTEFCLLPKLRTDVI